MYIMNRHAAAQSIAEEDLSAATVYLTMSMCSQTYQ